MTRHQIVATFGLLLTLSAGCSAITGENPSDISDYSVPIAIDNQHDREHDVHVTIGDDADTVYKEFAVRIPPETEVRVQPFIDLSSTEAEEFLVVIIVDDGEAVERTAEMNRCYGALGVTIRDDGSLAVGADIC